MYGFSKGETETTVAASPKIIADGSSVLIEGSVMDLSPAQPGTPAISDEDMSEWMEYLHMQQPMPCDITGVTVKLETLDPNGNFYEIDTVTSDAAGMFSALWEPPVPGKYTVIATFEGSNSYYGSYSETFFGVTEVSAGTTIEPAEPTEPTETAASPLITTEIAIIAAVAIAAIVGIIAFWSIKRK